MTTIEAIQMNICFDKENLRDAYKMPENNDIEIMFKLSEIEHWTNELKESIRCLQFAINQVNNQ